MTFQLFLYGAVFRVQHRGKQFSSSLFSKTNVHIESIITIVKTPNPTNDNLAKIYVVGVAPTLSH